ncbi:hypothetical protein R3P38DRAFT_3091159 [Favolaschia claudopus]|uniref:F-box domain-containing protein n=1 Tax=Favolaschia claudopus TaxID=2862362 RepID=A0AAV9ZSM7_9AGAR
MSEFSLAVDNWIGLAMDRRAALMPEYEDISEQISILRKELVRAERKANRLSAAVDECHSQLSTLQYQPAVFLRSPVRRLPPELVCEIFEWVVLNGHKRIVHHVMVPATAWKLAHVCRAWRDIARGYAPLWTDIEIDHSAQDLHLYVHPELDVADLPSRDDAQEALVTQLQLSQPAGLSICVYVPEFHSLEGDLYDTLCALMEESNRWLRFTLAWWRDQDIPSLSQIKGRLAQLEYLALDARGECWPSDSEFTDTFSLAPRLREIDADISGLDAYRSVLCLSHHRLTHVRLCGLRSLVFDILRLQSNTVIDAVLFLVDETDEASLNPPASVELPYLKRLSLNNDWRCECLVMPALTHLTLSGHIGDILSILNRSQCQLQTLDFDDCDIQPDTLHSLLRSVAAVLHHLRVGFGFHSYVREDFAGVTLQALMSSDSFQGLRCLELDGFREQVHKMVCDVLESLWNRPIEIRSLARVRLYPDDAFSDAIRTRVERLRTEGLDAKLEEKKKDISDDGL